MLFTTYHGTIDSTQPNNFDIADTRTRVSVSVIMTTGKQRLADTVITGATRSGSLLC